MCLYCFHTVLKAKHFSSKSCHRFILKMDLNFFSGLLMICRLLLSRGFPIDYIRMSTIFQILFY